MALRTVKTLAEVPGAYERGVAELIRHLRLRYGTQFYLVDDDGQAIDLTKPTPPICATSSQPGRSEPESQQDDD